MLDRYGIDAKITDIVDSYTWYIIPVFNVDGYEYTWTTVIHIVKHYFLKNFAKAHSIFLFVCCFCFCLPFS